MLRSFSRNYVWHQANFRLLIPLHVVALKLLSSRSIMPAPTTTCSAAAFPKIIATSTQRFFGITGHGPFDTCGPLFSKLTNVAKTHQLLALPGVKTAMLVLCDVPTTDKQDLEWAVALCMPEEHSHVSVPEELEEIVVPGHDRVATSIHHGPYQGLPKAWGTLCQTWIPLQNLQPMKGSREHVHYEIYIKAYGDFENGDDCDEQQLETQLFCPVQDVSE